MGNNFFSTTHRRMVDSLTLNAFATSLMSIVFTCPIISIYPLIDALTNQIIERKDLHCNRIIGIIEEVANWAIRK